MFYGWKLLAALSFVYFLSIGSTFFGFGVVFPAMIEDLGWTRAQTSTGFSLMTLSLGVCGPFAATMIQKFPVRRVMVIGGAVTACGAVLTAFTSSVLIFYVGAGLLMGFGMALQTFIPGAQLIANWFFRRRAVAIGVFMASGGVGAFVTAPTYNFIIQVTGSWRVVWFVMAGAALMSSVVIFFMVKQHPEDVGTTIDGITDAIGDSDETAESGEPVSSGRVYKSTVSFDVWDALKTTAFWFLATAASVAIIGSTIVNSQVVLHLTDLGVASAVAAAALGTQGLLNTGGRLVCGGLGERIDPKWLLLTGLLLESVAFFLLVDARTSVPIYAFVVLFGVGYGFSMVSYTTLIVNYFGPGHYATLTSLIGLVVTTLGAAGPILAGLTYDISGTYVTAFYVFSVVALVAAVAVFMMKPPAVPRLST